MKRERKNKMNELVRHIEKINAETKAWVAEDPKNRWGGELVTDPAHWAEYGIFTPEDYDKSSLAETIKDASGAAYGSKHRVDWREYSLEELKKMAADYCKAADEEYEREIKWKKKCATAFENRVQETIDLGAGNRETALRWILQAEDLNDHYYNEGYASYTFNLPSSYDKELDSIILQKEAA